MTQTTASSTLPRSTWALLTEPTVTWRQASEGWAVLVVAAASAVVAVAVVQAGRHVMSSRSSVLR